MLRQKSTAGNNKNNTGSTIHRLSSGEGRGSRKQPSTTGPISSPQTKKRFSMFNNEFDLSHELNTAIMESDKALLVAAKKLNDVAGNCIKIYCLP